MKRAITNLALYLIAKTILAIFATALTLIILLTPMALVSLILLKMVGRILSVSLKSMRAAVLRFARWSINTRRRAKTTLKGIWNMCVDMWVAPRKLW